MGKKKFFTGEDGSPIPIEKWEELYPGLPEIRLVYEQEIREDGFRLDKYYPVRYLIKKAYYMPKRELYSIFTEKELEECREKGYLKISKERFVLARLLCQKSKVLRFVGRVLRLEQYFSYKFQLENNRIKLIFKETQDSPEQVSSCAFERIKEMRKRAGKYMKEHSVLTAETAKKIADTLMWHVNRSIAHYEDLLKKEIPDLIALRQTYGELLPEDRKNLDIEEESYDLY